MNVTVITSDNKVWNIDEVYSKITEGMVTDQDIKIDLNNEGPDISATVLEKYIMYCANIYNYDPKRISIKTANQVQKHNIFFIKKTAPFNLVINARDYAYNYTKDVKKHFGIFIGRSNGPRLDLASYIYNAFHNESYVTYHYSLSSEYHRNNIGLEELVTDFNQIDISVPARFLKQCPIVDSTIEPVAQSDLNPAQQLLENDHDTFLTRYCNFLVEIVCETCYNGNTFFPTEKTWRPILLETPFIVQGPQWFLHRLRDLGFQTFSRWWDEGYSEDPANWQNIEIKKVIDSIGKLTVEQLQEMYTEMKPVLAHNKKRFMELTSKDFKIFENDRY
jgi:hypothetical protein